MMQQKVVLKPGKEKAIRNHHHWIFSGAVQSMPEFEDGDILLVFAADGEPLGHAYFNRRSGILGRMLNFDKSDPKESVRENIRRAAALRSSLFNEEFTNAYRMVNAEGDRLPGLIVDKYGSVLVVQIATLGMEKLKPFLVETLREMFDPVCIYEKSNLPSRREEDLKDFESVLFGELPEPLTILENGLTFQVDIQGGQKTGFFLDQREMRALVGDLSNGKRVLNCFGYTGGFSIYALAGGASKVDSVDISGEAISLTKRNLELNEFSITKNGLI